MAISKRNALKFLRNVPNINNGGCLIAAYAFIVNEVKEGRGEGLELVQLAQDDCDYLHESNVLFIDGILDYGSPASHFGWTYNGGKEVYDCTGKVYLNWYDFILPIPQRLIDRFCITALNMEGWVARFQRGIWLPKIEEFFGIDLSAIDK